MSHSKEDVQEKEILYRHVAYYYIHGRTL